nr:hypothetical protein [Tanacetum cinerariifolium]
MRRGLMGVKEPKTINKNISDMAAKTTTDPNDDPSHVLRKMRKTINFDAFTSTVCVEAWGRISFARALVEISSDTDLKKEITMDFPNEDGTSYTREVISVEYEWKPLRCADYKKICHSSDKCPKIIREPVTCTTSDMNSNGFTKVKRKKYKGKKADQQPRARHIDGIRLNKPKPNFYWQKTGTNKSGVDLVNKDPTDANSSNNKVNGLSTSNSFDILNNVDEGNAYGLSSSMGNQEEDQVVDDDIK